MRYFPIVLLLIISFLNDDVLAKRKRKHVGYLLSYQGEVTILRKKLMKRERGLKVKYENEDFFEIKAKKYAKLYNQDIVRTLEKSKAKLVLSKKQMLFVGPLSNLVISHLKKKKKGSTKMFIHMMYGKARSLVKKDKKEEYKIKTSSAVMGVRGTDFMVVHNAEDIETSVTTIKGEVSFAKVKKPLKKLDVKSAAVEEPELASETVSVKAGYTSSVTEKKKPKKKSKRGKKTEKIEVDAPSKPKPASIETLVDAAKVSVVKEKVLDEKEKEELNKEVAKEAKDAEDSFVETYTGKKATAQAGSSMLTVGVNNDLKKLIKKTIKKTPKANINVETSQFIDGFLNDRLDEVF